MQYVRIKAGCQPGLFFLLAFPDSFVRLPFMLIPNNPPPDAPEEFGGGSQCGLIAS